jgi:hypothetical protein
MACAVPNCIFEEGEIKIQLREGDMAKFDPSKRLSVGSNLCLLHYGRSPAEGGPSRTVVRNTYKSVPQMLPKDYKLDPNYWNGSVRGQTMHNRRQKKIQMGAL